MELYVEESKKKDVINSEEDKEDKKDEDGKEGDEQTMGRSLT